MALSFSRPDPSSPSAVASATFSSARRGFEQGEVRDLLRMVAAELARLQERERFLERELRTAQHGVPNAAVALDDEVVTRLLGEEAARILQTAREAGSQIKIRAEDSAARVLREATDEAQRLREEAEVEAARRRQDASADAESELQMAKQQGREMVNEARAYRERVLSELARRREMARQQIEQLVHGRDRLLQAFERARLAAVDVMAEMTPLGEPTEYVNLSPTTGPVPVMLPSTPRPPESGTEAPQASESSDDAAVVVDTAVVVDIDAETVEIVEIEVVEEVVSDDELAPVVTLYVGDAESDITTDLLAMRRAARAEAVAERAQAAVDTPPPPPVADAEPADATRDLSIVADDSVFQPSPSAPTDDTSDADDTPFGRRDAALTAVIVAAARKLKRVLADEQNDVLNILRRTEPVRSVDTMLPWEGDHAHRYATSIDAELHAAALAGAASVDDGTAKAHRRDINRVSALKPAVESLTTSIIVPLRERLARAVDDASGDNGDLAKTARSVYREWKTQRIDEHLDDVVRIAFGRGALAALDPGTLVTWVADARVPACPDCADNELAGEVAAGQAFPTGHLCVPAHESCRCMLAVADQSHR